MVFNLDRKTLQCLSICIAKSYNCHYLEIKNVNMLLNSTVIYYGSIICNLFMFDKHSCLFPIHQAPSRTLSMCLWWVWLAQCLTSQTTTSTAGWEMWWCLRVMTRDISTTSVTRSLRTRRDRYNMILRHGCLF